jgi:hypothetical protein
MIRFLLREFVNNDDTILKIASTPDELLTNFQWWNTRMWRVQAEIDGCIEDIAIVDLGDNPNQWGQRSYRIYGANPVCNDCFHTVDGAENVVVGVKTILACFFNQGRFFPDDSIGVRVLP